MCTSPLSPKLLLNSYLSTVFDAGPIAMDMYHAYPKSKCKLSSEMG